LERRIVGSILVVIVLAGIGMLSLYFTSLGQGSLTVPPPADPPGRDLVIVIKGDLVLWAEAEFWQDFMPIVPPEGAPFHSLIRINITNNGESTLTNFWAPRVTLYFNETLDSLVTLNLTTAIETFAPVEIAPGESVVIEYINERNEIYSPDIDEGTGLYARVLFIWNDVYSSILTTAPSPLEYTW
jgi:hypothetical protein